MAYFLLYLRRKCGSHNFHIFCENQLVELECIPGILLGTLLAEKRCENRHVNSDGMSGQQVEKFARSQNLVKKKELFLNIARIRSRTVWQLQK